MPVQARLEKVTTAMDVIRGVRRRYAGRKVLLISGKRLSPEELIARYEQQLASIDRVRQAHIAYRAALAEERAMRKPMQVLTDEVKQVVRGEFGPEAFPDFGWKKPKKPGPKTVASKLAGVEKREAKRRKS